MSVLSRLRSPSLFWTFTGAFLVVLVLAALLQAFVVVAVVRPLADRWANDQVTAEARDVGLVNQVFADHDAMLEGVDKIAREIASKAPLAVYGCKRMINYARDHTTAEGLD